jgi:tetratricopeptide (TPR) repeat protein
MNASDQPDGAEIEELVRLIEQKHYVEAIDAGEQLKVRYPSSAQVRKYLGHAFEARRQLDRAIAEGLEATRLAPSEPSNHFHLGRWYLEHARCTEAISECTRAIEIEKSAGTNSYLASSYFFRALAKRQAGDHQGALEDCAFVPDDAASWALGKLQSKKALVDELTNRLGYEKP